MTPFFNIKITTRGEGKWRGEEGRGEREGKVKEVDKRRKGKGKTKVYLKLASTR